MSRHSGSPWRPVPSPCWPPAPASPTESAVAVLQRADAAMGGAGLRSITFAGTGTGATFGQAFEPGMAWPRITYSSFSRAADYQNAALREDAARSRAEPTGGGAVPLMGTGEQRTTGMLRGSTAWNMVGPAPRGLAGRHRHPHPRPVDHPPRRNQGGPRQQPDRGPAFRGRTHAERGVLRGSRPLPGHGARQQRRPGGADRVGAAAPGERRHRLGDPVLGLPRQRRREVPHAHPPEHGRLPDPRPGGERGEGQCRCCVRDSAARQRRDRTRGGGAGSGRRLVPGRWLAQQCGDRHEGPHDGGGDTAVRRPLPPGAGRGAQARRGASRSVMSSTRTTTSTTRVGCARPCPRAPRW